MNIPYLTQKDNAANRILNFSEKDNLELLQKFRVSVCHFLEIIFKLDNLIKKNLIVFRLKNVISSATKKDEFIPDSLRGEFEKLSSRKLDELRDILGGDKKLLTYNNFNDYVVKIGEMVSDVAINESIIDDIHDKDLVYSLLALSFEEDTEIKNYAINFIFVMFANTQRLTKNLRSITLFRSEDEDLFLEL